MLGSPSCVDIGTGVGIGVGTGVGVDAPASVRALIDRLCTLGTEKFTVSWR